MRQLEVLNDAYSKYNIMFKQAGADWVVKPEWADSCQEAEMKTALHQGTYADLNVYLLAKLACVNQTRIPSEWKVYGFGKQDHMRTTCRSR